MGVHQALYSGVSGLATNSDGMSVISNNIANANTRSFKSDRAEFEDLLSVSLSESSNLGRGARLRNISTSFAQGTLSNTGGITDMGIQGDGFFVVRNESLDVKESNGMFYTRQGSFRFDRDGFISDVNGGRVQGYMADDQGRLSSKLTDIQVVTNSIPPAASTRITVASNLDVRDRAPKEAFDPKDPDRTSNHSSTVTIFDNMGTAHSCTIYFRRNENLDVNMWDWYAVVNGTELKDSPGLDENGKPISVTIAQGQMNFDEEGKPIPKFRNSMGVPTFIDTTEQSDGFDVVFNNGASPQKLQFNFGQHIDEMGKVGSASSTSMAAKSSTVYHSQNGFEAGYLKSIKIDLDGSIRGVYTNGLERKLAGVALATFPSNAHLTKVGRNSFIAPPKAGEPRIGSPGSGNRGSIYSASLEESNVDLAQQFVDMILSQRAFQANSKSITTTDSLMEEILALKR